MAYLLLNDNAKREFFSCADPFLIAHAMAHGQTVATHEVRTQAGKNSDRLPWSQHPVRANI